MEHCDPRVELYDTTVDHCDTRVEYCKTTVEPFDSKMSTVTPQ